MSEPYEKMIRNVSQFAREAQRASDKFEQNEQGMNSHVYRHRSITADRNLDAAEQELIGFLDMNYQRMTSTP